MKSHGPDPSSSAAPNSRYYSLDFWRGIACLLVVIFHAAFYATRNPEVHLDGRFLGIFARLAELGWVGAPFFFVISGYCITAACDSARFKQRAVAKFFLRRFRRIYPPYWLLFFFSFLIIGGFSLAGLPQLFSDKIMPIPSPFSLSFDQWAGNISLTEIWREYIFGPKEKLFLGHAWTLCYEEQFYAICGLALFLNRKWFFPALAGVSVMVIAALAAQCRWDIPVEGFFFDGRWLIFAAGVLIYYRLNYADGLPAGLMDMALVAGLYGAVLFHHRFHTLIGEQLFWGFLFACLIRLLHQWDVSMASSLWLRPVTLCGVMCYSLYLVHWPVVKGLSHFLYLAGVRNPWATFGFTVPLCIIVSACLAWGFHIIMERKFLNTPPSLLKSIGGTTTISTTNEGNHIVVQPVDRNFFKNFTS